MKKVKVEFSKILAIYLIVLLTSIVAFTMVAMWHFEDLSYLNVLITDIAAQIVVYMIYCVKAYHGKKSEEELNFERDKIEKLSDLHNGDCVG